MKEQIIAIIAEYMGKDASEISTTATFTELGLDSLDLAELSMTIGDKFGDMDIEVTPDLNTIDKLVAYIEENKN